MDLNYLLSRHQISLMRADAAVCGESRIVHRKLAAQYATMIDEVQADLGSSLTVQPDHG